MDLYKTDPEFMERFAHFAFDEVVNEPGQQLDDVTRHLAILATLLGCQGIDAFREELPAALDGGVTPVMAKEIIYQAVDYLGIGRVLPFLDITNEVLKARGVALPLEGQSTTTPENRFEKGFALQKGIFGEQIDRMYASAPQNQIHLQRFLSANCFGDYQTRPALDVPTRELLTYAILVSLGGCEAQVKGHIAGNVAVGNDKARLLAVTTQLLPYIGYPRTLNAIACLNEVVPEPAK